MGKAIVPMAIFLSLFVIFSECIAAQDINCIDNIATRDQLISCGNRLVGDCEAKLGAEVKRLNAKYEDNRGIIILLDDTVHTWSTYKDVNCALEGAFAARGQVVGELPVEAEKAKLRCYIKKYNDIIKSLSIY